MNDWYSILFILGLVNIFVAAIGLVKAEREQRRMDKLVGENIFLKRVFAEGHVECPKNCPGKGPDADLCIDCALTKLRR